jgi:MoaA/NifB/PqqE/SkfB family radical SAM enzyme
MALLPSARKSFELLKSYATGKPVWCSWQVTYACNYRCGFCDYWKEEVNYIPAARAREATLDEIRGASAKLAEIGSMIISVGGGEPFLRRDLADITAVLARHHFPVITTNGSLVTEQRARHLWEAGLCGISVSLDSDDPEVHDANRGIPGAAARARSAIQILSRTRRHSYQRVNIMCVLTGQNYAVIEPLLRFASSNSATLTVQPYSTLKSSRIAVPPLTGAASWLSADSATAHLLALKRHYKNFLSSRFFLSKIDLPHQRRVPNCRAGQAFFNIDSFLNVQKCVEFRAEPIGNLRDLSPEDLIERLRAERARNTCQACWYNCRGEVEGLYTFRGLLGRVIG